MSCLNPEGSRVNDPLTACVSNRASGVVGRHVHGFRRVDDPGFGAFANLAAKEFSEGHDTHALAMRRWTSITPVARDVDRRAGVIDQQGPGVLLAPPGIIGGRQYVEARLPKSRPFWAWLDSGWLILARNFEGNGHRWFTLWGCCWWLWFQPLCELHARPIRDPRLHASCPSFSFLLSHPA
jgi:hypothetical protein